MKFVAPMHLVPFDEAAASKAAEIRWSLEKVGTKIGPYDLLIAAQAVVFEFVLVTLNLDEFERVPSLKCESW